MHLIKIASEKPNFIASALLQEYWILSRFIWHGNANKTRVMTMSEQSSPEYYEKCIRLNI